MTISKGLTAALNKKEFADLTPGQQEEAVKLAIEIIRTDYAAGVVKMAADLKEAIVDGEIESTDDAEQWLDTELLDHERIKNANSAAAVLLASEKNRGAVREEFPDTLGMIKNGERVLDWALMASSAFRADIIADLGGDLDALLMSYDDGAENDDYDLDDEDEDYDEGDDEEDD